MSGSNSSGRRGAGGGRGSRNHNGMNSNNSGNSNNNNRGGGGGGRSSSRGGRPARGRGGNQGSRTSHGRQSSRFRQPIDNNNERSGGLRDEDVLIAFMPYLKGNHAEALCIHEEYQAGSDQRAFLRAAREFLARENASLLTTTPPSEKAAAAPTSTTSTKPQPSYNSGTLPLSPTSPFTVSAITRPQQQSLQRTQQSDDTLIVKPAFQFDSQILSDANNTSNQSSNSAIFASSTSDPLPSLFSETSKKSLPSLNLNNAVTLPSISDNRSVIAPPNLRQQQQQHQDIYANTSSAAFDNQRELSFDGLQMNSIERGLDALMDDDTTPTPKVTPAWDTNKKTPTLYASPTRHLSSTAQGSSSQTPTKPLPITPVRTISTQSTPLQKQKQNTHQGTTELWSYGSPAESSLLMAMSPLQPATTTTTNSASGLETHTNTENKDNTDTPRAPGKKEAPPPKRLWTHPEEQPGVILVKGHSGADYSVVLHLAPREELTAQWGISLAYLRTYAAGKYGPDANLETVLSKLTLGLFRRGCTENGMQASIVSKSVLGEFWTDKPSQSVRGKVPFYSPRTPGHVVFRLFWEDDPVYTLATGPTVLVRVTEADFESSVRFILSNFKGKKSNPTSLSSLHSLATILETQISRQNESAARATWGCIQEARKVLEACAQEHEKTSAKLCALEESVDELKKQVGVDLEDPGVSADTAGDVIETNSADEQPSEAVQNLKEKTRTLLSGRASCERKWRDSQLAFAGILRAVVTNQSMSILLRRDLIAKMRIEYELWCPLSEEFAIPGENPNVQIWYEPLRELPQTLTSDDFSRYAQARTKMQLRTLGFDPNTLSLEDILFPRNPNSPGQRVIDPGSVNVFNRMTSAMAQSYQQLFREEEVVLRRREMIRKRTEECIQKSGAFPHGTQVVIFGSSANGFGSPQSDLDMCLQLPDGRKLGDDQDVNGSRSMAKLAEYLEQSGGMIDVDTSRLSARIAIIKYRCPDPLPTSEGESSFVECDLSVHNPLSVLNTSLLRTYAEITPLTRVLSTIIKRWAKARDINNPARHTLSSYGYIIMLLHFLTYHKRTGNGLVSAVAPPEGDARHPSTTQRPNPLLPNLQWMDPMWPNHPRGTPYRELTSLPESLMPHPLEEDKRVNQHFYKPSTPNESSLLQLHFLGHDLSLAILLASFFRYYAYEFDYKRYVVSLHSTASRGLVEREVKAELDGWRNYSAALTIEDPFETFYDIAHVLRGGYYHRIRREFAVAYSKIADAAAGRAGSWNKGELRSMTGEELIDWVCEPIEKDENHS